MRILVVAPTSDIEYRSSELENVMNVLQPKVLLNDAATIDGLGDMLHRNEFDGVWFIAHGDRYGINLVGGRLSAGRFVQLARSQNLEFVFVNTCDSGTTAQRIRQTIDVQMVCTIGDVDDEDAYHFGTQFARHLAEFEEPVRKAFDSAKPPGDNHYILLR